MHHNYFHYGYLSYIKKGDEQVKEKIIKGEVGVAVCGSKKFSNNGVIHHQTMR